MEPSPRLRVSGLIGLFAPAFLLLASTCAQGATGSTGVEGGISLGNPPVDATTGTPDNGSIIIRNSPSATGTGQTTDVTGTTGTTETTPETSTSVTPTRPSGSTGVTTHTSSSETHATSSVNTETTTSVTPSDTATTTDTFSGSSSGSGSTPSGYVCNHSPCVAGTALPRNCDQTADGLADAICSANGGDMPNCCTSMWSNACAQLAVAVCEQVTCEDPGCTSAGDAGI